MRQVPNQCCFSIEYTVPLENIVTVVKETNYGANNYFLVHRSVL